MVNYIYYPDYILDKCNFFVMVHIGDQEKEKQV